MSACMGTRERAAAPETGATAPVMSAAASPSPAAHMLHSGVPSAAKFKRRAPQQLHLSGGETGVHGGGAPAGSGAHETTSLGSSATTCADEAAACCSPATQDSQHVASARARSRTPVSTLHAATVGSTPVPFSPDVVVGTEHTRSRVAGYSQPQHSFARPPTIVSRSLGTPVGTSPHTTARASPAHRPQLASVKCAGSHLGELLSCRLRVTTPRLEATSHCSHAGGFAFHGSGMSGRTPRWQAASTASPSARAGKRVRLHTRMKGGVRDEALELHVADAAWDQQVRASTARVQLAAALHAMFTEASTLRNALYVMCSHLLLSQGAWLSAAWQQQSVPAHHPIIEAANSLGDTWLAASLNAVCGWEADALPSTEDAAQPLWIAADGSVQRAVFSMTSENLEHTVKHVLLAGAADNHSAKMRAHGLLFQRLDYAYRHHATRGTCAVETAAYADHVTAARRAAAPSLSSVSGDHPLTSTHRNSGGVHTSCALRDPKHGPSAPDESTSTVGYTPAACAPSAAHKLGAVHKRRTSYWQARPTCTNSDAPKQESVEQADGIPTLSAVCAVCCTAATFEVEQPTSARGGGIRSAAWGGERVTALKSTAYSVRDEASPFPGCMPPIERKALEFAHEYAAEALPWLRTTRAADVLAFPRLQSTLIANPPTVRNMIHDHFGTFLEPLSTSCLQQTVHAPAPSTGGIGAAADDPGASVALTPQLLEAYTGAARPVHFFFIPQDVPSTFLGMPRLPQLIRTATRLVYRSAHAVWAQLQPHLPPSACDEAGPRLERPIAAAAPALPDDVVQYVAAMSRVWADLCAVSHSEGYGEQGGAVRDGVQRVRRGIMLNATLLLPMCYALLVSTSLCKSTVDAGACDDTLRMAATLAAHGSDHWIFRPITFSVQFTADTSMADMCLALWRRVNACFAVYYVQLLTAEGKHKCSRGPAMAAACAVAPAHPELGDSSLHTTAADECCAALLAPALGAPDGACAWDLSLVRNAQRGLRCRQGGAPLEHLFLTTYSSYRSMQQLANAFLQPLSGRPLCRMLGIAIDAASEAYTAEQLSAAHFAHKRRSSLQAAAVCPPPPAPVTPLGSLPSRSLEQTAPYLCQFIGCIMPPELTPRSHRDSNRVGGPPPAIAFDATQPDALLSLIALCLPPALECVPLDVSFSHDHFLRLMLASLLGYSIVFDACNSGMSAAMHAATALWAMLAFCVHDPQAARASRTSLWYSPASHDSAAAAAEMEAFLRETVDGGPCIRAVPFIPAELLSAAAFRRRIIFVRLAARAPDGCSPSSSSVPTSRASRPRSPSVYFPKSLHADLHLPLDMVQEGTAARVQALADSSCTGGSPQSPRQHSECSRALARELRAYFEHIHCVLLLQCPVSAAALASDLTSCFATPPRSDDVPASARTHTSSHHARTAVCGMKPMLSHALQTAAALPCIESIVLRLLTQPPARLAARGLQFLVQYAQCPGFQRFIWRQYAHIYELALQGRVPHVQEQQVHALRPALLAAASCVPE